MNNFLFIFIVVVYCLLTGFLAGELSDTRKENKALVEAFNRYKEASMPREYCTPLPVYRRTE